MPIGRTTTHRKITPMEEMNKEEWLTVMRFACFLVAEFSIRVALTVENDVPVTKDNVEQLLCDAIDGTQMATQGVEIAEALESGSVTARSADSFEYLAKMLDIVEWHYSYLTRNLTPTEELEEGYLLAKDAIARLANS